MTRGEVHFAEHPERYSASGCNAQTACPHAKRNRDNSECSTCGGLLVNGKWKHLTPAWFDYYADGKERPEAYDPCKE